MNTPATDSIPLAACLDVVEVALATVCRRLPPNVAREDLASVGKLALITALVQAEGSFDEVRAYCYVRVRGAMLDEFRRLDPLSRRQRERSTAILRVQAELSARLGRAALPVEIAVAGSVSVAEVTMILAEQSGGAEFANPELDALPDSDAPSPADSMEMEDLKLSLRGALVRLSSTQAAVLYRYYFEETTLDVIAADLGVSKERVRQIREAGEKKLREDFVVLSLWQSLLNRK